MANTFKIKLMLPPVIDGDVVSRELTTVVDNGTPDVKTLAKTDASVDYTVQQDSTVVFSLIDIDDAGNRSLPSVRTFTAIDNIPPAKPGEMNIEVLGEE